MPCKGFDPLTPKGALSQTFQVRECSHWRTFSPVAEQAECLRTDAIKITKLPFPDYKLPFRSRSVRISECDTNAPELQTKHTEATSEGVRGLAVTAPNVEQGIQGCKSRKKWVALGIFTKSQAT